MKPETPLISQAAKHMLLSAFFIGVMSMLMRLVNTLPEMELVFFRCSVASIFCVGLLIKEKIHWRGSNKKLLLLRGVFGTTALYTFVVTLHHMPLGTAVTVQYLSPIFTAIAAIFILKEKLRPVHWFFFIVSFSGVLLIKGFDERVSLFYLAMGILSAVFSALAYNVVRTMRGTENPIVVVLHFQLVGTLVGFAFMLFNWKTPQGWDWLWLFLMGLFAQLGQINLTKAFQQEKMAEIAILNYTGIIYAIAFGYFIFGETYHMLAIIGMLLVIGGVVMSIIYTRKKEQLKSFVRKYSPF